MFTPRNIAVFGLGYVGSVTAACLARLGHKVWGVDTVAAKVHSLREGRAPFYEPGLEDIIRETTGSGSLSATMDAEEALRDADVALICVGTPSERNGNLSLEYVRRVAEQIGQTSGPARQTTRCGRAQHCFPRHLRGRGVARFAASSESHRGFQSGIPARGRGDSGLPGAIVAGGGRHRPPVHGTGRRFV